MGKLLNRVRRKKCPPILEQRKETHRNVGFFHFYSLHIFLFSVNLNIKIKNL